MTIYTSKQGEKKDDKVPDPEVVTENVPPKDSKKAFEAEAPPLVVVARRRRSNAANCCVMLTALFVLSTGIIGGIYLYKHLAHNKFRGWCGVQYLDNIEDDTRGSHQSNYNQGSERHFGKFEEEIELDKEDGRYEKINVPDFDDVRRATILHDFEKNMTAIVDKDRFHCFVLPLNRTLVRPPKDFWDLITKLKTGYYMPNTEVVRETYRVVQPAVDNLRPFGYYIWRECHRYDTYRLEKYTRGDPIALTKRDTESLYETFAHFSGESLAKISVYGINNIKN